MNRCVFETVSIWSLNIRGNCLFICLLNFVFSPNFLFQKSRFKMSLIQSTTVQSEISDRDNFLENLIVNSNPLSKLKLKQIRRRSDESCKSYFVQKTYKCISLRPRQNNSERVISLINVYR